MAIVKPLLCAKVLPELRSNTLLNLGYKKRGAPGKDIEKILSEAIHSIAGSTKTRGIYLAVPIIRINKKAIITEKGAIRSPMFARRARSCKGKKSLVFMIATIGGGWKRDLGKDPPVLRQLIFDAAASAAAEIAADLVEKQWRGEAGAKGLKASMRFSPGYCDWDLKEQRVIFDALDASKIGVELTEHCLMVPEKSVSAVALVAYDLAAAAPCAFCKKDCRWRKIPHQSAG
jgi:hypothetical protein